MTAQALEGFRVLELCSGIAGPFCTKLVADMGADVVKIEAPDGGDEARRLPPFPDDIPDPEQSGLFLYLNSNKRGITVDIDKAEGRRIVRDLIGRVDILIEDRPPGELEALGLGYDALSKINPALIMASITPYGRSGPHSHYRARELNISHASGQGYLLPIPALDPSRPPVKPGGHMGECDVGLVSVLPLLAALFYCGTTGKGQFIEISRQEALISMQRVESVTFANDGVVIGRGGDGKTGMTGGIMPCKDGHVVLVTPQEHQWQALVELMGNPSWATGALCRDAAARSANAETINARVVEWMMQHTKEEIFRQGQSLSCPVAPVYTARDIVNSEQYRARGFFVEIDHPELGKLLLPSCAHQFSETPWALRRLAPRLGEHNEEVLCRDLGYSVEDLNHFKKAGAI